MYHFLILEPKPLLQTILRTSRKTTYRNGISSLPPFRFGSSWVPVDDDVSFGFVLPSVKVLFRIWRCCLDSLVRGGLVVLWVVLPSAQAAVRLGARFVCPGISGYLALPSPVRLVLACLFSLLGLGV